MFGRKRKFPKYIVRYGQTPTIQNSRVKKFRPRLSQKFSRLSKLLKIAITTAFVIFLIYGLFFSNYLKIKEIAVPGETFAKENLTAEISASIGNSIGQNIIFADTEEMELKILDLFPELEKVEVEKDYPDKLVVSFYEYPLVANVINESNTVKRSFIINSIGYVIKQDLENPVLPYIKMKSDEPINPDTPAIEATKLKYILDTITYFEDKFGMKINEVHYKKIPREIHLLTEREFFIWLDIQRPAEEQLKKLKKALVKLDIYKENLEYIDLRIAGSNGDKIIYKRRN